MTGRIRICRQLVSWAALVAAMASAPVALAQEGGVAVPSAANDIPHAFPAMPQASAHAPNILLIMTDDVGFGAASAFGGPVPTPNLERLAATGLRYNQFHTTAMCSPSRAALLTGRNSHAVGTGALTDLPMGAPGYTGMMPRSAATIAEVLRENGYSTAFFGKHHNVPKGLQGEAGPDWFMPNGMGFDYFFGFVGSDSDQWRPTLFRDGQRVIDDKPQPVLDQRLADDAIHWLHQQKGAAPDKPFLIYYAPGSAHTPHQAPVDWIARFRGKFAQGWEATREQTLARQKAMGLVPPNTRLPGWPADLPRWNSLAPQERAFQERAMEAFAGELAFQDAQFGRLLDELERMGLRDNTMIVFIEGDNGPDAAASPAGALAESGELANRRLSQSEHWALMDKIGGPQANSNYGSGWAQAMATPFPFYKQIASHLGGTRNGMVISWPARIPERGLRPQYGHVIDVFPTLLTAAGVAAPETVNGVAQQPVDGIDLTYSFSSPGAPSRRTVQYYEMLGNRAIYGNGWLAATTPQVRPWQMVERAPVNRAPGYAWELYDLTHDFNQTRDLARRYPDKLAEMQRLFAQEATHYNVDPINDRTDPARSNSWMQAYGRPRTHYDYWGAGLTIPLDSAPPIEGRGFTVTADLSAGDGVIAATGSQLGGWSFAIEKGHPAIHHALTLMPSDQFTLLSPVALAAGQHARVTFDFDYDGGGFGKGGLLSIAIDGRRVAQGRLERSITLADPHTESFDIGFDTGVPVVEAPSGASGFKGTLEKVSIDLGPAGQRRPNGETP